MPDYIYMLETRLAPEQQRVLSTVQDIARQHEMNVYLTGGAVRDLTSGFSIRDLDFSVQGNALKLQKELLKAGLALQGSLEPARVLYLLGPGGVRAEVSSTRSETFPKPGKPEYGPATMLEDLRRRDFTVNAMALSLNPGSRGLLMDPFNGVADIESKLIRILHNYSFLEDPSRLVRATRFATRFQWTLEEKTQARYDAAKENGYISHIGDAARGYELEEIGHEEDPLQVMKALEREGWMQHLYPAWTSAKADLSGLHEVAKTRQQMNDLGVTPDPSTANMHFLTAKLSEKEVRGLQKLMPRQGFVNDWQSLESEAKELGKQLLSRTASTPSQTWTLLMNCKPEALLFLAVTTKNSAIEQKLKNFLTKWPLVRQKLPYQTMLEMRITPDLPIYKGLLSEMFLLMLDSKLRSQQEIVKFLEPHSPPLPPPPQPVRRGRAAKKGQAKRRLAEPVAKPNPAPAATLPPAAEAPLDKPKPAPVPPAAAASQNGRKPEKVSTPAVKGGPAPKPAAKEAQKPAPAAKAAPNSRQKESSEKKTTPAKVAAPAPKAQSKNSGPTEKTAKTGKKKKKDKKHKKDKMGKKDKKEKKEKKESSKKSKSKAKAK